MTTSVPTTQSGVYQLALGAATTRYVSVSAEDGSLEADTCDLWYDAVRQAVLRAAPWPEARAHTRLAELAEGELDDDWASGDPDPMYVYAYSVPSGCLRPRYLTTFERFALSNLSNSTAAIMTNQDEALLAYTKDVTDVSKWSSDLLFAIVYALAGHIAAPLHANLDKAVKNIQLANGFIQQARVHAANQDDEDFDFMPPWLQARGTALPGNARRYIYPNGPLISAEVAASVT